MACLRWLTCWLRKSWLIILCQADGSMKRGKNANKVNPGEPQYYFELADGTTQIDLSSLPPREHIDPSPSELDPDFVYANQSCDQLKKNTLKIIQLDDIKNRICHIAKKDIIDSKCWDQRNIAFDDLAGYKTAQRDIAQVRKAILNDDIRRSRNFRRIQKANGIARYGPHTSEEEFNSDIENEQENEGDSDNIQNTDSNEDEKRESASLSESLHQSENTSKKYSNKDNLSQKIEINDLGPNIEALTNQGLLEVGNESYVSVILMDENQNEGSSATSGIGTDSEKTVLQHSSLDSRLQNVLNSMPLVEPTGCNKRTRSKNSAENCIDNLKDVQRDKDEEKSKSSYEMDKKKRKYCDDFEIPTPPELKKEFYQLPYVSANLSYHQKRKNNATNTLIARYDDNKNPNVTINSYVIKRNTKWRRWRLGNSQTTWPY